MESVLDILDRLERVLRRQLERLPGAERQDLEQEVFGLLRMARAALPKDLHQAQWMLQEAEGALARAREEARRLILDAQSHAQTLKGTSPSRSDAMASAGLDEAQREAERIRRGADEYAAEVLHRLEVEVDRILSTIRRGRQVLRPPGVARGRQE